MARVSPTKNTSSKGTGAHTITKADSTEVIHVDDI